MDVTDKIIKAREMEEFDYENRTVLLRLDINCPIDPITRRIANEYRLDMSVPTISYLLEQGAKLAIIAHQGDTLDYHNLIPMKEHAEKLSQKLSREIKYIDDVAGIAAQNAIRKLKPGEAVLLGNLRYLTEEVSTFENVVKLKPKEMLDTYLVRNLSPLVDYYVNDAFSAAHRNAPSMVAFQELKPSAIGFLFAKEMKALTRIVKSSEKPNIFVLGGLKISDAFGMIKEVLEKNIADKILTCGVVGNIMLMAKGFDLGEKNYNFIKGRSLDKYIEVAREHIQRYPDRVICPEDLAYELNGQRKEILVEELPYDALFMDIGSKTIKIYSEEIKKAKTIFVNGPAGAYERELMSLGTKNIWEAIVDSEGYSAVGGGDTVASAQSFVDMSKIDYVSTAGGALIRFLSGVKLPLIEAMERAYERELQHKNL